MAVYEPLEITILLINGVQVAVGVGVTEVPVGVTVGVLVVVGVDVTDNVPVGVGVTETYEFQKPFVVNHTLASVADENVCGVP